MDMPIKSPWPRRNAGPRNEGGEGASDPPPYYLHDLKSPGDVNFLDPWHSNHPTLSTERKPDFPAYAPQPPMRSTGGRSDFEHEKLPLHAEKMRRSSTPRSWSRLSAVLRKLSQSEPFWLALYFLFNLGLTLYNKIVLVTFPFPYTLTAVHAFCGSIGCYVLQEYGFYVSDSIANICFLPSPALGSSTTDGSTKYNVAWVQRALCHQYRGLQSLTTAGDYSCT